MKLDAAHRKTFTLLTALALLGNAITWLIPNDLPTLVARQLPVIFGRYSINHFYWNVFAAFASIITLWIIAPTEDRARRQRVFALVSCLVIGFITLLATDGVLRLFQPRWYEIDRIAFRRPPNAKLHAQYADVPLTERSYPVRRPGFAPMKGSITTDANGFRNAAVPASCQVLALGDSFTEGSRIDDDGPWPLLLAKNTGLTTYNLGMSGYSPQHSLAALKDFGLALHPRLIIAVIYEGNDFRAGGKIEPPKIGLRQIIGTSPLYRRTEHFIYHVLGRIRADADAPELAVLDWQPLAVPAGPKANYYSFVPKQIDDLLDPQSEFVASPEFNVVTETLTEMRAEADAIGARLAIAYAPVAAHVVLPLAADRIPPEKFRAFMQLGSRRKLPDADRLMPETLAQLDSKESALAHWCEKQGIDFISLTPALRDAAANGAQPYYTYDQHWSPVGHQVAARILGNYALSHLPAASSAGRSIAHAHNPESGQLSSGGR